MIDRLETIVKRYHDIEAEMMRPEVLSDREKLARLGREQRALRELVEAYDAYRQTQADIEAAKELLRHEKDPDLLEEQRAGEQKLLRLEERIKELLLPRDPNDDRNVIVEIAGAEGGQEAALFARDLFDMYSRFAERKGWKVEVLEVQETGIGGFDKIEFEVRGDAAYSQLKFEGGVHRVQRVPRTEAQGRVHTSAATVVVMPEADPVEIEIPDKDLDIKTSTSQGHGGQSVNTTYSKIILTHIPTGIVVNMQDERSQLQNREKALRLLRAKLYERKLEEQQAKEGATRRSMVLSGNRSEKIRTYNYKENRVTDHRINLTLYKLDRIMAGELDELISALQAAERAQLLEAATA